MKGIKYDCYRYNYLKMKLKNNEAKNGGSRYEIIADTRLTLRPECTIRA